MALLSFRGMGCRCFSILSSGLVIPQGGIAPSSWVVFAPPPFVFPVYRRKEGSSEVLPFTYFVPLLGGRGFVSWVAFATMHRAARSCSAGVAGEVRMAPLPNVPVSRLFGGLSFSSLTSRLSPRRWRPWLLQARSPWESFLDQANLAFWIPSSFFGLPSGEASV